MFNFQSQLFISLVLTTVYANTIGSELRGHSPERSDPEQEREIIFHGHQESQCLVSTEVSANGKLDCFRQCNCFLEKGMGVWINTIKESIPLSTGT
eukprot:Pgem_evm1s4329